MTDLAIAPGDVIRAAARISEFVNRTPVLTSRRLNELLGTELFFKCENMQRIGAFKARGAHNAVLALSPEKAARGVLTHSSGNHAAALALAARSRSIDAIIVMPENAPAAKVASVRRLGGEIHFCEPTIDAREATAAALMEERGATLVPPYNDPMVMAGQGTAAMELLEEIPGIDAILAPVGGGGLMAGTATIARYLMPDIQIIATEPEQANDAYLSWAAGALVDADPPNTIADGLRTTLGDKNLPILRAHLDRFVTVSESAIVDAMRLVWEVLKIVIEPSSAVPVAAILEKRVDLANARTGIILTGGNVDLDHLPWQSR
ncbi:pyridoxal-phosphate dependent enzyme [Tsuneonella suprasediminis]|uniref:pyridoxal-phosphate dependent enzyme n=1 Tax=Tsuneonella suprasediminis TaxID=2306996 RepID=UPI001F0BADCE|nr:pyridoxal-phosphate dependent enzyme [Tsuneonella suprasediminis]